MRMPRRRTCAIDWMIDMNKLLTMGYARGDGGIGIRNILLIVYISNCAAAVAKSIADSFPCGQDVDVLGCEGCRYNPLMEEKLLTFLTHPNVGAALIVGQGCEPHSAVHLAEQTSRTDRAAEVLLLNQASGFDEAVERGKIMVSIMLEGLRTTPRKPFYYSDLIIASECGGSDYTSGLVANPLLGRLNDDLRAQGATVLFEEMYEAIGLKELLLKKCADEKARLQIGVTYDKFMAYAVTGGQFALAPGNIRGGLTTIEEKSMGAVCKIGTSPITGVLKLCQKPPHPGLYYVDMIADDERGCGFSVSEDASSDLLYATCGAHVCFLTSGLGHVVNNPIIPTIKITGNSVSFGRLSNDMDFDASSALTGEHTMEELKSQLHTLLLQVLSGRRTKGEALGHREAILNFENQTREVLCL